MAASQLGDTPLARAGVPGVEVDPQGRRAEVALVENQVLNCQRTAGD
jgi:hypothetical protein